MQRIEGSKASSTFQRNPHGANDTARAVSARRLRSIAKPLRLWPFGSVQFVSFKTKNL